MRKRNGKFSFFDVSVITILTSIIMFFLGAVLVYKHLGGVNYALLGSDSKLQEFISAYNSLVNNYYDTLDKDTLIDGAIDGMYSKVDDPYTTYLDDETTNTLNSSLSGEYEGIGVKISNEESGKYIIAEVFDDTPASESGLLVNDEILKVNDTNVSGVEIDIASLIKKSAGSTVNLTINRSGSEIVFNIPVEKILVPAVYTEILQKNDKKIGYIQLTVFNDTADMQFTNALNKLETEGIEGLIIDVRSNSGGYLQVAKNIAEIFLEKGKVIYSLESKEETTSYKDETNESKKYPITVLINKSSASASEILAAALKYSYGAILVGETSYGKGKVQEKASLSDGTTIKYTTAKWLTPNGDCIDGIGLKPDVEVSLDTNIYNSEDATTDTQIMEALNRLAG